ncbi:hypothetical protein ABPG72_014357 [Tetrahymena utriculariae]
MDQEIASKKIPFKIKIQQKENPKFLDTTGMFIQRCMKVAERINDMNSIDKCIYQFDSVARLLVVKLRMLKNNSIQQPVGSFLEGFSQLLRYLFFQTQTQRLMIPQIDFYWEQFQFGTLSRLFIALHIVANIIELSFQFCQSILFCFYLIEIKSIIFVACILQFLSLISVKKQVQCTEIIDPRTISLVEQIFFGSKTSLLLPLIQKDINQIDMMFFNKFNKINQILFYIYYFTNLGFLFFNDNNLFQGYYILEIQLGLFIFNTLIAILKSQLIQCKKYSYVNQLTFVDQESFSILNNMNNSVINLIVYNSSDLELDNKNIQIIAQVMRGNKKYTQIIFKESLIIINQYGNFQMKILDSKYLELYQQIYQEVVSTNNNNQSLNVQLSKQIIKDKQLFVKYNFQQLKNMVNKEELICIDKKSQVIENLLQIKNYQKLEQILQKYNRESLICFLYAFNKQISPFLYNNPTTLIYDLLDD